MNFSKYRINRMSYSIVSVINESKILTANTFSLDGNLINGLIRILSLSRKNYDKMYNANMSINQISFLLREKVVGQNVKKIVPRCFNSAPLQMNNELFIDTEIKSAYILFRKKNFSIFESFVSRKNFNYGTFYKTFLNFYRVVILLRQYAPLTEYELSTWKRLLLINEIELKKRLEYVKSKRPNYVCVAFATQPLEKIEKYLSNPVIISCMDELDNFYKKRLIGSKIYSDVVVSFLRYNNFGRISMLKAFIKLGFELDSSRIISKYSSVCFSKIMDAYIKYINKNFENENTEKYSDDPNDSFISEYDFDKDRSVFETNFYQDYSKKVLIILQQFTTMEKFKNFSLFYKIDPLEKIIPYRQKISFAHFDKIVNVTSNETERDFMKVHQFRNYMNELFKLCTEEEKNIIERMYTYKHVVPLKNTDDVIKNFKFLTEIGFKKKHIATVPLILLCSPNSVVDSYGQLLHFNRTIFYSKKSISLNLMQYFIENAK
ncbi:hypothetical protein A3Q56_01509 [Intoshia linei]|uniref:Uncharacterized protein n=1 Tax=Intoshia linei TaxID=1819745 RepID=A0A177B8X1_9BILA|nr:hypothetical protein A3Q56_01509 [Intoshia linei]